MCCDILVLPQTPCMGFVWLLNAGRTIETGDKIKVCEFREGDTLGDLEFVNGHAHMTDAVCMGICVCTFLHLFNYFSTSQHIELF